MRKVARYQAQPGHRETSDLLSAEPVAFESTLCPRTGDPWLGGLPSKGGQSIPDCLADPDYAGLGYQRAGGFRTILGVPLLREGVTIGVFTMLRNAVRPFSNKQIDLVTTFADQAVIAIENVRLFEEVQARTSELPARSRSSRRSARLD